mgnify:FL=1
MDIINVSCNLDKFSFYEGINTKEKLGKYLLDRVGYRNTYFCKEGYVVKLEEVLIARYDGQNLPSYFEKTVLSFLTSA